MRVRLTTDRATSTAYQQAGEVVDLPEVEAYRLLKTGSAELLEPESMRESPRHETTTIHRARPRRK